MTISGDNRARSQRKSVALHALASAGTISNIVMAGLVPAIHDLLVAYAARVSALGANLP